MSISLDDYRGGLQTVLEEVFARVHGFLLDKGTSLFETLEGITAEEASIRVSSQSANLAAQVNHVNVYLESIVAGAGGDLPEPVDWEASWRVDAVNDEEWAALIARLRRNYESITGFVSSFDAWDGRFIGGAFAIVGHTAYHLGEIRQGIGVIRDRLPSESAAP